MATAATAGGGGAPNARAAFKAAVRANQPLFGLFLNSASPLAAEQLAGIEGYDYMLVDIQHAPTDYANLAAMITAVNAAGKPALVRVEGPSDRGAIQQSLDLGAAGVMIPTVNCGERDRKGGAAGSVALGIQALPPASQRLRRLPAHSAALHPPHAAAADAERAASACFYPSETLPGGSRSISWPIRRA
jgi:4-hydroxy-2-oxoheptanedioate aldolase